MINEIEILNEIKSIRLKTELLTNPLYNDAGGSMFWSKIDNILKGAENELKAEIGHLTY